MRRPTLQDVAKRAHVSVSTASAALSGVPGVSAATRALVVQAAEQLGYRPNTFARGLRAGDHTIVGILSDPVLQEGQGDSPQVFIRSLLNGLSQELTARGALPMMLHPDSPAAPVDVLLLIEVGGQAATPRWLDPRTPLVVAGIPPLAASAPVQLGHDFPGMADEVLAALSVAGHRVALLLPVARMRHLEVFEAAYLQWCAARACPPQVIRFDPTPEQARRAGEQAVVGGAASAFLPSGRCEWSVLTGIQQAAERLGRQVPVIALGAGVVEAEFGQSVGYLSLEGLAAARVIAETVTQTASGAGPTGHIDLPWRLVVPELLQVRPRA